jgi:hypothetical protein
MEVTSNQPRLIMLAVMILSKGTWNPKAPEMFIEFKSILKSAGYESDSIVKE